MQPNYHQGFDQEQRDWENCQLDDNPYNLQIDTERYNGWRDGWITTNKKRNPS